MMRIVVDAKNDGDVDNADEMIQRAVDAGAELERDFSFGVVRQLFEPALAAAADGERAALLAFGKQPADRNVERLGERGLDALVFDQAANQVGQHRIAMFARAAQLAPLALGDTLSSTRSTPAAGSSRANSRSSVPRLG